MSLRLPKLCACGCGKFTSPTKREDKARGLQAGDYSTFVHGHYHVWKRQQNPEWGKQATRQRERENARKVLVEAIQQDDDITTATQLAALAPRFRIEGIQRMINLAREYGTWGSVREIIVRAPVKRVDPYERKEIEYEHETELPFLVLMRHISALDEPNEEGNDLHERIASHTKDPCALLMEKEEMESEDATWDRKMETWYEFAETRQTLLTFQPFYDL